MTSASYLRLLLVPPVSFGNPSRERHPDEIRRAVVLVPGFLGTRDVLSPLEQRFESAGVATFCLNSGLHTVLSFATNQGLLIARVREIRRRYPRLERIDFVAHSMGGFVVSGILHHPVVSGVQVRMVTLGTPFQGTWVALFGCGFSPSAQEMFPLHPRYRSVGVDHIPKSVRLLTIAGADDMLAMADRCAHPSAEHAEYLVLPVDHAGLLLETIVFRHVLAFLERA